LGRRHPFQPAIEKLSAVQVRRLVCAMVGGLSGFVEAP